MLRSTTIIPAKTSRPPGDDSRFVANLSTYRCVFSFTHAGNHIYRHLSISEPSTKYPSPAAAFALADLFGFTGYDESELTKPGVDWLIDVNERDHCVILAQAIAVTKGGKFDA